ncbi:MAG: PIG-L family deacetylase [Candidatus Paceibacterota bacterium]
MKPLVAIFAHPDDEAFGPGGMIALEAAKRDVFLICVTDGSAGQNSLRSKKELSAIRKEELLNSAKALGIKGVIFLNYKDGTLSNQYYHKIANRIENSLKKIDPDTLLTFESNGVSGHLDHIAVSFITTYVFKKMKSIRKLLYYCVDEDEGNIFRDNYFIYFPNGHKHKEMDLKVDISPVWDKKVEALCTHKSQKHDCEKILKYLSNRPKFEYFMVLTSK